MWSHWRSTGRLKQIPINYNGSLAVGGTAESYDWSTGRYTRKPVTLHHPQCSGSRCRSILPGGRVPEPNGGGW